jgi:hypothetical protein
LVLCGVNHVRASKTVALCKTISQQKVAANKMLPAVLPVGLSVSWLKIGNVRGSTDDRLVREDGMQGPRKTIQNGSQHEDKLFQFDLDLPWTRGQENCCVYPKASSHSHAAH